MGYLMLESRDITFVKRLHLKAALSEMDVFWRSEVCWGPLKVLHATCLLLNQFGLVCFLIRNNLFGSPPRFGEFY